MDNRIISYLTLRKVIGILGISLSFICILGGLIFNGKVEQSISAYYYTQMRDIMVGILVITGAFLLSYKGYDLKDNIVADISGVAIILVALISPTTSSFIHGLAAVVFFLSIAYMSYFQFSQGENNKKLYRTTGIIIVTCLLLWVVAYLLKIKYSTLIIETIMMVTFGISWLIKGVHK